MTVAAEAHRRRAEKARRRRKRRHNTSAAAARKARAVERGAARFEALTRDAREFADDEAAARFEAQVLRVRRHPPGRLTHRHVGNEVQEDERGFLREVPRHNPDRRRTA